MRSFSKRALGLFVGVALTGVFLLALSYIFSNTWFSDAAVNFGSALALFSPLLLAGNWLERRLGQVETTQDAIRTSQEATSTRVSELGEQVQGLQLSQAELRDEIMGRVVAARAAEQGPFSRLKTEPSWPAVRKALVTAKQMGLISEAGFRIPVEETQRYLRFLHRSDSSTILVWAEGRGTENSTLFEWRGNQPISEILAQVTLDFQRKGHYPGNSLWQPETFLSELSEALIVLHDKASGVEEGTVEVGDVFQLCLPQ